MGIICWLTAAYESHSLSESKGWVTWRGGDCPVPPDSRVEVRLRDGGQFTSTAGDQSWGHGGACPDIDILRYRVTCLGVEKTSLELGFESDAQQRLVDEYLRELRRKDHCKEAMRIALKIYEAQKR